MSFLVFCGVNETLLECQKKHPLLLLAVECQSLTMWDSCRTRQVYLPRGDTNECRTSPVMHCRCVPMSQDLLPIPGQCGG